MGFAQAVGATGCSGGPTPGAVALEGTALQRYGDSGIRSLGIYNCRKVAGTDTWSVHAEGRAVDLGVTGSDDGAPSALLEDLLGCRDGLLQRIIWDHRVYDARSPDGRTFTGGNPHTDHLHVEMSWAGARGEIDVQLPQLLEDLEDEMVPLLVAWRDAQWVVAPDLSSKRGLSQGVDVQSLLAAGYRPVTLTESLMSKIPAQPSQ